jgi:hypothetical protein
VCQDMIDFGCNQTPEQKKRYMKKFGQKRKKGKIQKPKKVKVAPPGTFDEEFDLPEDVNEVEQDSDGDADGVQERVVPIKDEDGDGDDGYDLSDYEDNDDEDDDCEKSTPEALQPPIHVASKKGLLDAVVAELDAGVAVDLASDGGRTPLYLASFHNHPEVVSLLLERGAGVDKQDFAGSTPLIGPLLIFSIFKFNVGFLLFSVF